MWNKNSKKHNLHPDNYIVKFVVCRVTSSTNGSLLHDIIIIIIIIIIILLYLSDVNGRKKPLKMIVAKAKE